MEQEIDLRPYFLALIKRWRFIGLVVIVAVAAAVIAAVMTPSSYTAVADVLVLTSSAELQFDPRFVTSDTSQLASPTGRRDALLTLASSGMLEEKVIEDLPENFTDQPYNPGDLVEAVEIQATGDLIRISTGAVEPERARAMAEAWASNYVQLVNEVYAKDEAAVDEIQEQLNEAQQRYNNTQQELETYIGNSQTVQLEQQVKNIQDLLDGSREANQSLYTQYLSRTHELELILNDAQTLREQVDSVQSQGFSDSLAALMLRARVVGSEQLPVDLRFDNPGTLTQGEGASLADLDVFIKVVQQRRSELIDVTQQLAQDIAEGSASASGLNAGMRERYERELTLLQQQFEQQKAQQLFLEQQRNVALESLSILQRKLDEQIIAAGASEAAVRFVGTSIEPPGSVVSQVAVYSAVAMVLGLFLGIAFVIIQDIVRPRMATFAAQPQTERPTDHPVTS
jgi:uncharacterized protein involved in exopolysaccharide biosynthesis